MGCNDEGQSLDLYIKLWKRFSSDLNFTLVTALCIAIGIRFQILMPLDIGLFRNFCIFLHGVLNLIFLLLCKSMLGLKLSNNCPFLLSLYIIAEWCSALLLLGGCNR